MSEFLIKAGTTFTAIVALITNLFTPSKSQVSNPKIQPTQVITVNQGWQRFTNNIITFEYPPAWKIALKSDSSSSIYKSLHSISPQTKSGLALFNVYFYDSQKGQNTKKIFDQFDDPYTPSVPLTIDNHQAKRIHLILTPKRIVASERIIISVPEKSAFIELSYTHSGYLNFDDEVAMYVNPLIKSIKLK